MGATCGGVLGRVGEFSAFCLLRLGMAIVYSFSHDVWCGSQYLKEFYTTLFACSFDQSASVYSVLDFQVGGEGWIWNMRFHGIFHDWKLDADSSLLDLIYPNIPIRAGDDRML